MINFIPTKDRVLIKPIEDNEKSVSGLVIPDVNRHAHFRAEVISVGPGRRLENGTYIYPDVKVGDKVYILKETGIPFNYNGENYQIVNDSDIHGFERGE